MTTYFLMATTPAIENRRVEQRLPPSKTSISDVQLAAGHPADLINVSHSGALLEGDFRMRPSMRLTLRVTEKDESSLVSGRVIRCSVVALSGGGLRYRFAVAFDKRIDFQIIPDDVAVDGQRCEDAPSVPPPGEVLKPPSDARPLNSW